MALKGLSVGFFDKITKKLVAFQINSIPEYTKNYETLYKKFSFDAQAMLRVS